MVLICHDLSSLQKWSIPPFKARGLRCAASNALQMPSSCPGTAGRARKHNLWRFGRQVFAMRGALRFLALGQAAAPCSLFHRSPAGICGLWALARALASRCGAATFDSMHSRDPRCSAPVCRWAAGSALLHAQDACWTSYDAFAHRPMPWQPFRRGYYSDPSVPPRCEVHRARVQLGGRAGVQASSVALLACTCSLCTLAVALAPVLQLSLLGIPCMFKPQLLSSPSVHHSCWLTLEPVAS